jgi:ribonuclease P protein component, eubacterial
MRFRPEQHIRRQSDFRAIRERGHRYTCGAFTFWCLRRDADPAQATADLRRAGFIASTAAVGHAVRRNRAKRCLREIFRRHQENLPAGTDILLSARHATLATPFPELESRFLDACRKAVPSPQP